MYFHRYTLTPRTALNARSTAAPHEGVLLRLPDGGVGCLHPWPVLGDPCADELLETLHISLTEKLPVEKSTHHPRAALLLRRALYCAGADGEARREGRSLFDGLTIPLSHATLPDAAADYETLAAQGFREVKIKVSGPREGEPAHLVEERFSMLTSHLRRAVKAGLRLRLDANLTFSTEALEAWLAELPREVKEAIDFLEDPVPWSDAGWRALRATTKLRLAADQPDGRDVSPHAADVRIIKPALMKAPASQPDWDVLFTSYMDHPVGQMHAAWCAASYAPPQLTAGLLTHGLFEKDAWLEQVQSEGPQLIAPAGTGLGFDELVETTPWRKLR